MPTAAKLFAAISMAFLATIVSEMYKPLLPEGTDFGYFTYVNAIVGLIVGWRVIGKRTGRGIVMGINNGITGVLAMLLVTLFIHSFWEMLGQSMQLRFKSVAEALRGVITKITEYGALLLEPNILITLALGAIFCGLLAEAVSRRWR